MEKIYSWVQAKTEAYLTNKKAVAATNKANRSFKSEVLGWIDALVFAVFFVLILNQYFLQLFVIPSPSMVATLEEGDRVLVNKQAYGIELYPCGPKVLDSRTPDRDEIITFYNPEYESSGPVKDVLSQIIYLGTLSFVNIDRDENGQIKHKLYVKRAIGLGGDTVKFANGDVYIRASGTNEFVKETDFREQNDLDEGPHRSLDMNLYEGINARARLLAYQDEGYSSTSVPSYLIKAYQSLGNTNLMYDAYAHETAYTQALAQLDPTNLQRRSDYARYRNGIYVPFDKVLPLGDNRDNSQDGRYFGPIDVDDINGRVVSTLWPLSRIKSFI